MTTAVGTIIKVISFLENDDELNGNGVDEAEADADSVLEMSALLVTDATIVDCDENGWLGVVVIVMWEGGWFLVSSPDDRGENIPNN